MNDDELEEAVQSEIGVEEAIPLSEIAATPADLPPDFGMPGAADFADPAWDEVDDEEEGEVPDFGEPREDDEDPDDFDDDEMSSPGMSDEDVLSDGE